MTKIINVSNNEHGWGKTDEFMQQIELACSYRYPTTVFVSNLLHAFRTLLLFIINSMDTMDLLRDAML